jgi:hypothetical protein
MADHEETSSQLNIEGDVGAGSAIGSGQVTADLIAGRDIILQDITPSEREERLQQLSQRLARYVDSLERVVQAPGAVTRPQHPYLGLTPYTLNHHRQFWGRERLTRELVQRVAPPDSLDTHLLILYGAPGVGKTSLVRAGLQPHLIRRGHLPFYIHIWRQTPTDSFYRLFLEEAEPAVSLLHVLTWMTQATGKRLYLIFDQFEAFLGPHFNNRQRANFIAQLGECLQVRDLDVVFILVVRTEQYAGFNAFKPCIPTIFHNEQEVPPLSRGEALAAITRPLTELSDQEVFTPDLLEVILDDLDDQGVDPTQLQIVCDTLWERRGPDGAPVNAETYHKAGGRKGILGHYLQSLLERHIKPQYQDLSRAVLVSLLSSEGKPAAKTRQQLARSLGDSPELDRVLNDLGDLGLIYAETDASGQMVYALSHRYLEKVIELDPDAIDRNRAEECLEAGLREFRLHQFALAEHTYQFIKRQVDKGVLAISPEAEALWQRSRKVSAFRHLMFRVLIVILLSPLLAIPALGFGILVRQADPATRLDTAQPLVYVFIGLAAALAASFTNGLGATIATLLEYRFSHWPLWRRFGLFLLSLLSPGVAIGILGALVQPSGAIVLQRPEQSLVLGLIASLFLGLALYLSLPRERQQSWWGQMRSSVIAGLTFGLLLAAVIFLGDSIGGGDFSEIQRKVLWIEVPVYLTTLTTIFAFGLEVGDRLLLGPPRSSCI